MEPGSSFAGELLVGTLVATPESPCLQLKALGQTAIALLWPPGFTVSVNPIRVSDEHGTEVAAEGDTVTLAGVTVRKPSSYCKTAKYFGVVQAERGIPSFAP